MVVVIRLFSNYPEGVVFAVLLNRARFDVVVARATDFRLIQFPDIAAAGDRLIVHLHGDLGAGSGEQVCSDTGLVEHLVGQVDRDDVVGPAQTENAPGTVIGKEVDALPVRNRAAIDRASRH